MSRPHPRRRSHWPAAIPTRRYDVGRGLTNAQARRRALVQDRAAGYGDFRGFKYDDRRGVAWLT